MMEAGPACTPRLDDVFGPLVHICRQGYDFTLFFEQSILTAIPAVVSIVLLLIRFLHLLQADVKTLSNHAWVAKSVAAFGLVGCQLALLVLWTQHTLTATSFSIASAGLNLLVSLQLLAVSYLEHSRSIRPSSIIILYLLLTLLLDLAQARTLFLRKDDNQIAGLFSAMIGIKTIMLVLESGNKRSYLSIRYHDIGLEATSGLVNRSLFWWLNPLFISGCCTAIGPQDLPGLDQSFKSERLGKDLYELWNARSKPEGRHTLIWTLYKALRQSIAIAILPRLLMMGFNFAQPFLITRTLELLSKSMNEDSRIEGYGLIGATVIIYLGIAVSTAQYNHSMYIMVTKFRGMMISLIYKHTLTLKHEDHGSAAVTLMSTDVDNISTSLIPLNETWAETIEVIVGTYLLARQLGWICVVPLIFVAASAVGASQIIKRIGGRQKRWVDAVQQRIAATSSMLANMRSVKMMGLSNMMTSVIHEQRIRETRHMAGFRWMLVWKNIISNIPYAWAPAWTFAVYAIQAKVQHNAVIDTPRVFTSLSLITLVTSPAAKLLSSIPTLASSLGCFDRIQMFLSSPPHVDSRRSTLSAASICPPDVIVKNNDISLTTFKDMGRSDNQMLLVKSATIRPHPDSDFALRGVSLSIKRSSITMLYGPVGSGKTTLLKALLGEIPCQYGSIHVSTSRAGFCAQTAWLPNASIKRIICGSTAKISQDEQWYRTVLQSCALDVDVARLPEKDDTTSGSKGTKLSGGQKQRIALARAIYARNDLLVLDDVLSALDTETRDSIIARLIGKDGLLRQLGTTVILATHATQYSFLADNAFLLSSSGQSIQEIPTNTSTGYPPPIESCVSDKSSDSADQDGTADLSTTTIRDMTRPVSDASIYKYYFGIINWHHALVFVLFVIVNVFSSSFSHDSKSQLGLYIGIYFLLALFNSVGMGGYIWAILVYIAPSTARKAHLKLLTTVMNAPQRLFTQTDTGSILNRFSQDMTLIEGSLPTGVLLVVSNFFSCIAGIALISTGSAYMAITIPATLSAIFVLQKVYLKTSRQLRLLDIETRSPVYSHFLETLDGISTIRAFGWQNSELDVHHKLLDASQQPYYLMFCVQRWLALVLDLIVAALAVMVVALAMELRSVTDAGLLGVSLNNILSFNIHLSSVITGWTMFETSLGAISRLQSFERTTESEASGREGKPPRGWQTKGSIEFTCVSASYNVNAVAIKDVSLEIRPGEKIAICGRTGSGKSSLISAILGLIQIDSGCIKIDDIELSTLHPEIIRTSLITIPQDNFFFTASVRLNVDPTSSAPDTAIIAALKKVHLWDLLHNRGGLDADMHSVELSKGQQQLFALARAILCKDRSMILIMDEMNGNVDMTTANLMDDIIMEEFHDHTVLNVAHRSETLVNSDRVVVMQEGRVVEFDSPGMLMQKDSVFKRLIEMTVGEKDVAYSEIE